MNGDTEFQKSKIFRDDPSWDTLYPKSRLSRAVVWGLRGDRAWKDYCLNPPKPWNKESEVLKSYLVALEVIDPHEESYFLDEFIENFVDNAGALEFDDLRYFNPYAYSKFLSEDIFKKLKVFYERHLYKHFRRPFTVFSDVNGNRVADLRRVDARDRIYEGQEYRVILRDAAENLYGKYWCLERGIHPRSGAEIGGIVFRAIKLEDRGVRFVNSDGWSDYNKLDSEIFARWHSLIKIIET